MNDSNPVPAPNMYDNRLEITSPGKLPMGQTMPRLTPTTPKMTLVALKMALIATKVALVAVKFRLIRNRYS